MQAPYPGMDAKDPPMRKTPSGKRVPDMEMMQRLFDSGSFTWTGFYLAPTHAQTGKKPTWMTMRGVLVEQGWGTLPIYFGFQQSDTTVASWATKAAGIKQARADAVEAATLARDAGFPDGTVIYLDVEATGTTASYVAYVSEWVDHLATVQLQVPSGTPPRYFPGVYVPRSVAVTNPFGDSVALADRWVTKALVSHQGTDADGQGPLDPWGWPRTPDPNGSGLLPKRTQEPVTADAWQWGFEIIAGHTAAGAAYGYEFTDYDNNSHRVIGDLDYNSSQRADPSSTSGDGVINEVESVSSNVQTQALLGGLPAPLTIRLRNPAARPLGVDVEVTDGTQTRRLHFAPGLQELAVAMPTQPVDVLTYLTFSARTSWWRFSRDHEGMTPDVEPDPESVQVAVRPPQVTQFTITPRVRVDEKGQGELVLEGAATSSYRVTLDARGEAGGHLVLRKVPADVGFSGSDRAKFEFYGNYGTSGGITGEIHAHFLEGNTTAATQVFT